MEAGAAVGAFVGGIGVEVESGWDEAGAAVEAESLEKCSSWRLTLAYSSRALASAPAPRPCLRITPARRDVCGGMEPSGCWREGRVMGCLDIV